MFLGQSEFLPKVLQSRPHNYVVMKTFYLSNVAIGETEKQHNAEQKHFGKTLGPRADVAARGKFVLKSIIFYGKHKSYLLP